MTNKQSTKKKEKRMLHLQIWISGLLATGIYIATMFIINRHYSLQEAIISFVVFNTIWIGAHYLIFKKRFKVIDES